MSEQPNVSVCLKRTVNLGDYASAACSVSLNNVPPGASQEEIEAMMDTGALVYKNIQNALCKMVEHVKKTQWEKTMGTQEKKGEGEK